MEEDALRKYCSTMIARARSKQLQTESSDVTKRRRREHDAGRGKERMEPGAVAGGGEFSIQGESGLLLQESATRQRGETSLGVTCQGPAVQAVPLQLISMLRRKTLHEDARRAAEVELRGPSACAMCERRKASLALRGFIRRKTTHLQFQVLKGRLNTLDLWRKWL